MAIKESNPKGFCGECKYPKMKIDNNWVCPNCSSQTNTTSGIVSKVKDPGHDYFVKEGMVETADAAVQETPVEAPSNRVVRHIKGVESQKDYEELLEDVFQILHKQPIADMAQAKQLLKLKKKVLNLQNDIKLFLEVI